MFKIKQTNCKSKLEDAAKAQQKCKILMNSALAIFQMPTTFIIIFLFIGQQLYKQVHMCKVICHFLRNTPHWPHDHKSDSLEQVSLTWCFIVMGPSPLHVLESSHLRIHQAYPEFLEPLHLWKHHIYRTKLPDSFQMISYCQSCMLMYQSLWKGADLRHPANHYCLWT